MARKRVLFAWIGHTDLKCMAYNQSGKTETIIRNKLGPLTGEFDGPGPIKTLVEQVDFDEIVLLSNNQESWNTAYSKWLGLKNKLKVIICDLDKPNSYSEIFRITNRELEKLKSRKSWQDTELCIHLSPGTPAMTAVWVLLGKTRFPATFYETYNNEYLVTDIPFDLTLDVLPDLLKNQDSTLQHLSAQGPSEIEGFEAIAGDSRPIRDAVGRANKAAIRDISVLLLGESGTGKELFAQAMHNASPRKEQPFIAINCAAISRELLESELFGHVKGAFTGANQERKGAFEQADGGTLFLDEVGECDLEMQAKLLRVLQPPAGESPCLRKFTPVGGMKEKKADVRIIAATNRNLVQAITDGEFREDLYYRLAVINIKLPPLRERKSDLKLITEKLLKQINHSLEGSPGYEHKYLSAAAKSFVNKHDWPGNVRQLHNVLLQSCVMAEKNELTPADLQSAIGDMPANSAHDTDLLNKSLGGDFSLDGLLSSIQEHYLQRAMQEAHGVKKQASELLGISNYQTLDHRLKKYKLEDEWK